MQTFADDVKKKEKNPDANIYCHGLTPATPSSMFGGERK